MIDVHCHLEQKDYNKNREELISEFKKKLKAVITSCAHYDDFDLSLDIVNKHSGFVYCTAGLHPEYIEKIDAKKEKEYMETIRKNYVKQKIVAIGEIGLDYHWIKDEEGRKKQREMFARWIRFAKELKLPILIHTRDATKDTVQILEDEGMKDYPVLFHLFCDKKFLSRVIENGWSISIGPLIRKAKDIKKIVRDAPMERIMLETDSPWFELYEEGQKIGVPTNVKIVAEKIAEVKKISFEEVEKITDKNAYAFFRL